MSSVKPPALDDESGNDPVEDGAVEERSSDVA